MHFCLFRKDMSVGGITVVSYRLAKGLMAMGHQVDYVTFDSAGPMREIAPSGLNIIDIGKSTSGRGLKRYLSLFLAYRRYLQKQKPDHVISTYEQSNLIAVAARLFNRHKHKLVLTRQALLDSSIVGDEAKPGLRFLFRWFYPVADFIVGDSKALADHFREHVPESAASKVRGIYNPVLIDDIYERAREPIDEPWLNDKQSPVIIGIGRYAYQKNFDMLIRAFALARKEVDCRLILVGEGPDKPLLESLIDELELRDSIKLVPVVTNPYPWYAHSDIYALSSNYEGLPTVVIEALALDCKLVSTDCMTGPREILEDGKLGTLVPVGDTEAFGKALVDAVRSKEKPQQAFNPEKFSVLAGVLRYCKLLDVPVPESEETKKLEKLL
jgi:glycosyltransferase involved in cell wall biosynthesis